MVREVINGRHHLVSRKLPVRMKFYKLRFEHRWSEENSGGGGLFEGEHIILDPFECFRRHG